MKHLFILPIRLYQLTLSRILPPMCRFTPSCSQYAITAYERFGVVKGSYLALRRILRCHPFNEGGYDPVPTVPTKGIQKIKEKPE
ncbi:MAG: membrane protein insertion efficiency factor YidD [Oscillospiraceae bacterium]|nr:membrane protein insertion efficiency factor YidD [Oscillospiraceae bacterium]